MAIINPEGLFSGERLAACSDAAQLHWVRLFTASNTFARLELSYRNILATAYQSMKKKPTEEEIGTWIGEYVDNFLLFVYQAHDGSTWGQWLTSAEYLSRYQTAADRRSPTPDPKALETFRRSYVEKKQRKSLRIIAHSEPHLTVPIHTLGIGVGNGIGIGEKQKPSPTPRKRSSEPKHSPDPRHIACKTEIFTYYRDRNEGDDPDWEGREGRALGMFLGANPKLTAEGVKKLLAHRARSEVNHADRPSKWIGSLKSYRNGPLDKFGKPLEMANGHNANGNRQRRLDKGEEARRYIDELYPEEANIGGSS